MSFIGAALAIAAISQGEKFDWDHPAGFAFGTLLAVTMLVTLAVLYPYQRPWLRCMNSFLERGRRQWHIRHVQFAVGPGAERCLDRKYSVVTHENGSQQSLLPTTSRVTGCILSDRVKSAFFAAAEARLKMFLVKACSAFALLTLCMFIWWAWCGRVC